MYFTEINFEIRSQKNAIYSKTIVTLYFDRTLRKISVTIEKIVKSN